MKIKLLNIVFLVIFILLLLIPLVFANLSGGELSEQENRFLSTRPSLSSMINHPQTFIREFDSWFSDNVGFREDLIAAYKKMDTIGNQNQYTNGQYTYLIGQQGHNYFAGVNGEMISKFQGKNILDDERLQSLSYKLSSVKQYLDKQGIPFIMMFCADKETIYPEFYPQTIKQGPEPVQLDIITQYLSEHTNIDVFNIRQCLISEKENYLVFNISSGDLEHFNEAGAFFSYRELMKHVNTYFPNLEPIELDDINITYDENEIPRITFECEISYKALTSDFFDDVELIRPFSWENSAYENNDSSLPVILLMRDSYSNDMYLSKFIPQNFSKTILIHYSNMARFQEYVELYKPDIVVFETAERQINMFTGAVLNLPDTIE